jgi:nicotinamide mononucleotide transporter
MTELLSINKIFFTILGYQMSYIEFFGTMTGLIAVWLSAKANIWSWPIGIINVILFFFLFYQVQLYPDMFLQVFFFITNILGWWRWLHPDKSEEDKKRELRVTHMPSQLIFIFLVAGAASVVSLGMLAKNLHELFPVVFSKPSAFPYADSFVSVMSIIATYLMVQKKVECWVAWFLVNAVACSLYFVKGIKFVGIEYVFFCFITGFGLWNWIKELRSYNVT